jgi:hypothetical protein
MAWMIDAQSLGPTEARRAGQKRVGGDTALIRFSLALALLVFISFPTVLLGWSTFYTRDFSNFGFPLAYHLKESYLNGKFPLWNPFNFAGLPFLAQWNTLCLYPLSGIFVLLPLPWSLNFFNLVHLYLGGLGMFCLTRRWLGEGRGAGLAGVAYAFGGVMVSSLMWPNNIAALGWLPFVIMAVERAVLKGGRWLAISALVVSTQFLTGAPEIVALTWVGMMALTLTSDKSRWNGQTTKGYLNAESLPGIDFPPPSQLTSTQDQTLGRVPTVAPSLEDNQPPLARRLVRLVVLLALTLGLVAVQLLPFLELLANSQRGAAYSRGHWSLGWAGLVNFLVPLFRTVKDRDGIFFQADQQWITSYYSGIVVLTLALVAVTMRRGSPRLRWMAALAAFCLVMALGPHAYLYSWLKDVVPGLGIMRYPIKFIVPVAVLLPILAGYGFRGILRREATARGIAVTVAALATVTIAALALNSRFPRPGENLQITWTSGAQSLGVLMITALALVWHAHTRRVISVWILPAGVAVLAFSDLCLANRRINPVANPALLTGRVAEIVPRPKLGESRVMVSSGAHQRLDSTLFASPQESVIVPRQALVLNANLLEQVPKLDGFFSLYLPDPAALIGEISKRPDAAFTGMLDFLGVSHISNPERPGLWEPRTGALPMLTLVSNAVFLDKPSALKWLLSESFKPREHVLLPEGARPEVQHLGVAHGRIVSGRVSERGVEASIECDGPMFLVIAQAHYPGWKATVDGKAATLWSANHGFQALQVGSGRQEVKIVFRPWTVEVGAWISFGALGICGLMIARGTRPKV